MVNASAWPMINAPTKAPGMLPMPPNTAATKAFRPGRMPNWVQIDGYAMA